MTLRQFYIDIEDGAVGPAGPPGPPGPQGPAGEGYLPAGTYSAAVISTADPWVKICGAGVDRTIIQGNLVLGPGGRGNGSKPGGELKNLTIDAGGVGACLTLNALRQFRIENVELKNADIGLDLINNCFGLVVTNLRVGFFGNCNVGVNIREGGQCGSDLSFNECWINGKIAAAHISPNCTNIHFRGGQLSAGAPLTAADDAKGVVIYGKDYTTGAVGGCGGVDFTGVDFEGFQYLWALRGFGEIGALAARSCKFIATAGAALGIHKTETMGNTRGVFDVNDLGGTYTGPALLSYAGPGGNAFIKEVGTHATSPLTVAGTNIANSFSSMLDQSNIIIGISEFRGGTPIIHMNGAWLTVNVGKLFISTNRGATWTAVGTQT